MAAALFEHLVRTLASGQLTDDTGDSAYRALASSGVNVQDALGELAYLTVGADGRIGTEEEQLLQQWFAVLDGGPQGYGKRFDSYAERRREGRLQRVNAIAATLTTPETRRLAYAVVFALTNSDLARAPSEERFEADVTAALSLDEAQIAEIEQLVMSRLQI